MAKSDRQGGDLVKTLLERFEGKYQAVPWSGCWIWEGGLERNGYARVEVARDRRVSAHRLSWELHQGQIPNGLCVLHRCDVRCCVNPSHLFLGTKGANNTDRRDKGRNDDRRGQRNTQAKLTESQVAEIRSSPLGSKSLSALYSVSARTIRKIRAGTRWSHC